MVLSFLEAFTLQDKLKIKNYLEKKLFKIIELKKNIILAHIINGLKKRK